MSILNAFLVFFSISKAQYMDKMKNKRKEKNNRTPKAKVNFIKVQEAPADSGQAYRKKQIKFPGTKQFVPLSPQQIMKQLQLKQPININDASQLTYLMYHILNYPSLEEAQHHKLASRLGSFDINKQNQINKNRSYCKCCGFVQQEEEIPLCTSFSTFPSVGISTFLFFSTIKNLIFLLLFVTLTHSIYSLLTNLYIAGIFSGSQNFTWSNVSSNLIYWISLESKVNASNNSQYENVNRLYIIQMWIGVGVVVFWSLILYLIKYFQRKYEAMVDGQTISAADFSIVIENYPQNMTQEELQRQLNSYAERLQDEQCRKQDFFHIQKISLSMDTSLQAEDEQQMNGINQKYLEMLEVFADWVFQYEQHYKLPFTPAKRFKIYQKFHMIKNQRFLKGRRLLRTLYKDKSFPHKTNEHAQNQGESKSKKIAIITFKYSSTKDLMARHNTKDITKKIRHIIRCCPTKNQFVLMDPAKNAPHNKIKITKAPEPEDIKWQNLSITTREKFVRKFITYFITAILLGLSFGLVYLLENVQVKNENNFSISIIISLTIGLVNFFIGFLIRYLTYFEKDYTETDYQTSLAVKSIWAQLLNSIAIPFFANFMIENKNIYGKNGLSSDVIYLALTNSFLPPLTKLIDPYFRYVSIRAFYYRNALKERLLMKQIDLNETQELMEFETGYEYIYFINLYLFTAYFVTIQPCISIFALIGMFWMYWIHKYSLFNRVRRPVPGTDLVNAAMGQMVSLGPIFFALGALSWSHFIDGYKVKEGHIIFYIPNIVSGGLSTLFFIFPFSIIFDKYLPKLHAQNLTYSQCRILLNSEYDRTNPATMQGAIKQYEEYMQKFIGSPNQSLSNSQKQLQQNHMSKIYNDVTNISVNSQTKSNLKEQNNKKIEKQTLNTPTPNTPRKQTINKEFINRKKQLLKSNLRMRSKLGGNSNLATLITEFVGRKTDDMQNMNNEINEEQQREQQENEEKKLEEIKAQKFDKEEEMDSAINFILPNLANSSPTQKEDDLNKNTTNAKAKSRFYNKQNINEQTKSNYRISKQQPNYKPSKIDLKFQPLFPPKQKYESFSTQVRNDQYMSFFNKNGLLKNQSADNHQGHKKYENNPYDKAFV